MINTELFEALTLLEKEKNIPVDYMLERIETALQMAYRRTHAGAENVARINKAADMAKENEQSVAQQDKALIRFSGKFATAMDFIGRNLPLKRKRKAFRKIVEA